MNLQTKWQQARQMCKLPNAEKRILLAGAVALPCTVIGLRFFGFKRWSAQLHRWAQRCQWRPIATDEARSIRRTLQLMGLVIRFAPQRGNCLSQSLTLWWLLQCQGIASDLRIGVRSVGDQFQAHAWIEVQGQPLNEIQDVKSRFVPFSESVFSGAMPVDLRSFALSKEKAA
jgi:hypothetical protein